MRTAVVLGSTGLIGARLVAHLADEAAYSRVRLLTRRALDRASLPASDKISVEVVDLAAPPAALLACDDLYSCLGSTIKKAGSQEAYRHIDLEIPLACARVALGAGAKQLLVVSSVGANKTSGVFYNRIKGELEEALGELHFPEGLSIFRPSVLLGDRSESRPLEAVAQGIGAALGFAFVGGLKKYRAISGDEVARAMVRAALLPQRGSETRIYEGPTLFLS